MGQYVIASYRSKTRHEEALLGLVHGHIDVLGAEGLATAAEQVVLRAADGAFVETFEWISAEAIEAAHSHPVVVALWERFSEVYGFVPMSGLKEGSDLFLSFERVFP